MAGNRLIHEFLNALEDDPALLEAYENDPQTTMEEFGLDERQRAILEGTNKAIRDEVKNELNSHVAFVIRMVPSG